MTLSPRSLARALRTALLGAALALAATPATATNLAERPRIERCEKVRAPSPPRLVTPAGARGAARRSTFERHAPELAPAQARAALDRPALPRFLAHGALLR